MSQGRDTPGHSIYVFICSAFDIAFRQCREPCLQSWFPYVVGIEPSVQPSATEVTRSGSPIFGEPLRNNIKRQASTTVRHGFSSENASLARELACSCFVL